ncbi:MAG: hypothetical protein ACPGWR_01050 [Ardenticatenaceae bacterium]
MQFAIQVGNPTILAPQTKELEDLSEVIEELFPMETENVILYWNWIPVRIGYRYDFSYLIDKLLPLLSAVLESDQGQYQVSWTSTTFYAHWYLTWDERQLTIEAEWLRVVGKYEGLLNNHNTVRTSKDAFLREWKGLLSKLIEAINLTALEIEAQEELDTLYQIHAAIAGFGKLYQSPNTQAVWPIVQTSHAGLADLTREPNGTAERTPLTVSAQFSEPHAESLPQALQPA